MNTPLSYWHLRDHPLLATLDNARIKELSLLVRSKRLGKNEILYLAGEATSRVYLLAKGIVKTVDGTADGQEVIRDIFQKGDVFGDVALAGAGLNAEYAQALSAEAIVLSFGLPDVERILEKSPLVSLTLSRLVGHRLNRLQNRFANLVLKDVRERLVDFLKDWARAEGQPHGEHLIVRNYLTQLEIAQLVGTTRQTVAQVLGELQSEGKLSYSRREIVLSMAPMGLGSRRVAYPDLAAVAPTREVAFYR